MGEPPARGKPIKAERRIRFQDLCRRRVQRILLVSSLYDSFILAEDGQLSETVVGQFASLNPSITPDLTRVSTGAEALEQLRSSGPFDLIVASLKLEDMHVLELARRVAARGFAVPVILLAYDNRALTEFRARHDLRPIERAFLWQGDARILLALVRYMEDRWNVEQDTAGAGVPAIIVVEDNVRFYSSFLPMIYGEVVDHTRRLISEELNLYQKMLRMRARPKILLAESYEEAWDQFTRYEEHVLGVISDIEFPRGGRPERLAGVELARRVREERSDVPLILQSSFPENEQLARAVGAAFLLKGSPTLLGQLRQFMLDNFGFGDFVFQLPDGPQVARASDLKALVRQLERVPPESIAFHGERNHFSYWLKARGEYVLAERLRPRRVSDYATLEELRADLIRSIGEYRQERDRVVVADFDRAKLDGSSSVVRIGGGSLGGKARGLAFVNRLLRDYRVAERFPGVRISVPQSVVLATDVFDRFLAGEGLGAEAIRAGSDAEVERRFLEADLPGEVLEELGETIEVMRCPLAVRSSGLLEDSPAQPFAGVYQTYMLPNDAPDERVRLAELVAAVKRVWASTFSQQAKGFLRMTPYRLEEEKMAVIVQQLVGQPHGTRFYPDFAGVARSHNFYAVAPMRPEDGIVAIALGFGRMVVEGGACLRFCPRYPELLPASSVDEALGSSQREFFALELGGVPSPVGAELVRYGLDAAEQDGTLARLGSTYSPENDTIYDGISRPGVRFVSFAPVLKHGLFPLAELLELLLAIAEQGTSSPVEIEFAGNLSAVPGAPSEFAFLQMRPLAQSGGTEEVEIGPLPDSHLVCRSSSVLGNGRVGLRDALVVDRRAFDRHRSRQVAAELARFDAELQGEGRPYLLVGVGRWGSADPWLGIPVSWNQIAGARVIVEAGFRDLDVEPSQGTHFFQNLVSCNVGYFTVGSRQGGGFIDWDWLAAQPASSATEFVRRLSFERPLVVKMSGRSGRGVILKPGEEEV
jgi:CheY-like chemotaxis protein